MQVSGSGSSRQSSSVPVGHEKAKGNAAVTERHSDAALAVPLLEPAVRVHVLLEWVYGCQYATFEGQ